MSCHLKDAGLQVGLLGRRHSSHLFEVLRSLFFHDVDRVVDGDDTDQTVFFVHHGKGGQVVLVEELDDILPVIRGLGFDDVGVHDVLDEGLIGIHEQILDGDDALQGPLVVHDVAGVDRFLVHAVLPDVSKRVLHGHGLPEADILGGHDGAGRILRILQEFIDLGTGLRCRVLQDTLHDVRRQLLDHIDGIIDRKIFDDVRQLFIGDAADDMLLLVQFQAGEDVRRKLLREHSEHDHRLFRIQLLDKCGDVDLIHLGKLLPERPELSLVHQLKKRIISGLFLLDLIGAQFSHARTSLSSLSARPGQNLLPPGKNKGLNHQPLFDSKHIINQTYQ